MENTDSLASMPQFGSASTARVWHALCDQWARTSEVAAVADVSFRAAECALSRWRQMGFVESRSVPVDRAPGFAVEFRRVQAVGVVSRVQNGGRRPASFLHVFVLPTLDRLLRERGETSVAELLLEMPAEALAQWDAHRHGNDSTVYRLRRMLRSVHAGYQLVRDRIVPGNGTRYVKRPHPPRSATEHFREAAIESYGRLGTAAKVAAELGIPNRTACYLLTGVSKAPSAARADALLHEFKVFCARQGFVPTTTALQCDKAWRRFRYRFQRSGRAAARLDELSAELKLPRQYAGSVGENIAKAARKGRLSEAAGFAPARGQTDSVITRLFPAPQT